LKKMRLSGRLSRVGSADGVFWLSPITSSSISHKRFIELIWKEVQQALRTSTRGITSIHFSDHIAHSYMNAICDDLPCDSLGFPGHVRSP
jgi:hypothetical protein